VKETNNERFPAVTLVIVGVLRFVCHTVVEVVDVVGAVVVPAEYEPPAGGPAEAETASHVLPEHPATHTKGAIVCDTIPNTPLLEEIAEAT
jgi:hypothetical protein